MQLTISTVIFVIDQLLLDTEEEKKTSFLHLLPPEAMNPQKDK